MRLDSCADCLAYYWVCIIFSNRFFLNRYSLIISMCTLWVPRFRLMFSHIFQIKMKRKLVNIHLQLKSVRWYMVRKWLVCSTTYAHGRQGVYIAQSAHTPLLRLKCPRFLNVFFLEINKIFAQNKWKINGIVRKIQIVCENDSSVSVVFLFLSKVLCKTYSGGNEVRRTRVFINIS